MKKISFLMAVHNEEKLLKSSLEHLSKNIPYKNYEVLIGLDGCTDKSEKIVKNFVKNEPKKFRYFVLNKRNGKPAVINNIIKRAYGEIIIINDADWKYTSENSESMTKLINLFDDKRVGGIAESFPVEWDSKKINEAGFGYKMVAYSSYYWLQYQKEKFSTRNKKINIIKTPNMWLTNIFRKELFKANNSLGDDFERTQDISNAGYKILFFTDLKMPRMIAIYNKIPVRDLFRQKIRTAIARRQLEEKEGNNITTQKYYGPLLFYMIRKSLKNRAFRFVFSWIVLTIIATLYSKLKNENTKEGWKRRIQR